MGTVRDTAEVRLEVGTGRRGHTQMRRHPELKQASWRVQRMSPHVGSTVANRFFGVMVSLMPVLSRP